MKEKLRVGFITRTQNLLAWQYELAETISRSSYATVALLFRIDSQGKAQAEGGWIKALLVRVTNALEGRALLKRDASSVRDSSELFADVSKLKLESIGAGIEHLKTQKIDVLIDLVNTDLSNSLSAAAKYGIWSVHHGEAASGWIDSPGFWEVFSGMPVTESRVCAEVDGIAPIVLSHSFASTDPISVRRNLNKLCWKSVSMVLRELKALHESADGFLAPRVARNSSNVEDTGQLARMPSSLQLAAHIARTIKREVVFKLDNLLTVPQWILLFRFEKERSTSAQDLHKIVPPKDLFWADPHIIFRNGQHWIFFEECAFSSGKGHICALSIDGDGKHGMPVKVLERPYHLSYPFVFEEEGELFMVPETSENRTIELYRCVEFPGKWELVETLREAVEAVDATLFRHDGKWWLFTNIAETPGASSWDELFLFHSDSLVGGKWTPHPMNPIVSDVRRARPAGAIFRQDGKLYRPAQDCGRRYGYATRIHHIIKLSTHEYSEIEVSAIEPTWDKKIIATHTFNHANGLMVIDGLQPRFSL